ncbi:MAG: hypothetical protein WBB77_10345 [Candidatus Nanopelagicales bacterium]
MPNDRRSNHSGKTRAVALTAAVAVGVTGLVATGVSPASASPGGTLDTAFTTNLGTGTNNVAADVAVQSDHKIVVVGDFSNVGGTLSYRVGRFGPDGSPDTTFNTNVHYGLNGYAGSVAVAPDGKIVVGGTFTGQSQGSVAYQTAGHIARFNAAGTPDTSFRLATGTGLNNAVFAVAVQPDGKVLVGGIFTTQNGVACNGLARFNANGTPDTTFRTNINTGGGLGGVTDVVLQSDGKILVGGNFNTASGVASKHIARYNSNGTLDTAFSTQIGTGFNNNVRAVAVQPDGKILVTGVFTSVNGVGAGYLARLNSQGTVDTGFTTNANAAANRLNDYGESLARQPDGKVVVGGNFTTVGGTASARIARFNSNGTVDTDFRSQVGTGFAPAFAARVALQPIGEGKIIAGAYNGPTFNGTAVKRITRLSGDYIAPPRTAQSQKPVKTKLKKRGTKTVNGKSARTRQGVALRAKAVSKKNKRCVVVKKGPGRKLTLKTTGKCRKVTVKVRYSAPGTAAYLPYKKTVTFKAR